MLSTKTYKVKYRMNGDTREETVVTNNDKLSEAEAMAQVGRASDMMMPDVDKEIISMQLISEDEGASEMFGL